MMMMHDTNTWMEELAPHSSTVLTLWQCFIGKRRRIFVPICRQRYTENDPQPTKTVAIAMKKITEFVTGWQTLWSSTVCVCNSCPNTPSERRSGLTDQSGTSLFVFMVTQKYKTERAKRLKMWVYYKIQSSAASKLWIFLKCEVFQPREFGDKACRQRHKGFCAKLNAINKNSCHCPHVWGGDGDITSNNMGPNVHTHTHTLYVSNVNTQWCLISHSPV